MAEPLKNWISRDLLEPVVRELRLVWPAFDTSGFFNRVFDAGWEALELKQRIRHIARCLGASLPPDYGSALEILKKTVQRLIERDGEKLTFEYGFFTDFVEVYGLDDPGRSLEALELFTRWTTAEFAVRPFLLHHPERTYAQMQAWAGHPNPLVRRLASEGFRPRLPWGMGVPALKRDPAPILPVLEKLKNDPAETVRRSVANNLNDISKDHPELALQLAQRWYGQSSGTNWVVRHGCRGLLKKGHADALAHFGFEQNIAGVSVENLLAPGALALNDTLDFAFELHHAGREAVKIRLEYRIDYRTGGGKTSSKVFQIKTLTLVPGQVERVRRRQPFRDYTTRKHHTGAHRLAILVNGRPLAEKMFEVVPPV